MRYLTILTAFLTTATNLYAQDFHKGGFFDSSVTEAGFFAPEQAGIPIKNDTGVVTTRPKHDSWEVTPERASGLKLNETEKVIDETKDQTAKTEKVSNTDSFEVKSPPTD